MTVNIHTLPQGVTPEQAHKRLVSRIHAESARRRSIPTSVAMRDALIDAGVCGSYLRTPRQVRLEFQTLVHSVHIGSRVNALRARMEPEWMEWVASYFNLMSPAPWCIHGRMDKEPCRACVSGLGRPPVEPVGFRYWQDPEPTRMSMNDFIETHLVRGEN